MADVKPTIDLIDGALRDYISPDAMRWVPEDERGDREPAPRPRAFRDSFGAPGDRIPYQFLTEDEREALHAWVELHDVDHTRVPIDTPIEFDAETNEWLIPVHMQRGGRSYLDENGEVAQEILRCPSRADLPWPRIPEADPPSGLEFGPTTRVWIGGEEISHLVSDVTVERQQGQRTRIGFNGGDPEVRDNIRVEFRQGGATYVIDETQAAREAPLPRLATGPLRDPLSRADWRDYWTAES